MKLLRQNKYIVLVLLCILPSLFGLIHQGFFVSDDGNWMTIRFSAFYEALRSGQFPVRFLPRLNNGFGYPVADFLYPLFMYLGIPIKVAGVSFVNTIKIIFGLGIVASAIFSFLWLKKIFSQQAAWIGATVIALFPYHVWDMYHRGSVGEILALGIIPFILWQIERKSFFWSIIGISLLIPAHNTLALLFLPIFIVYMWLRKSFTIPYILLVVFYSLGIAAFFWIPALFDKQFTVFDKTTVSNFYSYFSSAPTLNLLGYISFIAIVCGIYFFMIRRISPLLYLFFILGIISIFFALPISQGIWVIVPGKNLIQFPFRLLSITIFSVGFLCAYTIAHIKKYTIFLSTLFLFLILASSFQFFSPANYQNQPDTFYSTNQDSTTVKNEYMPIWVKSQTLSHTSQIAVIAGKGTIDQIQQRGTHIQFIVHASQKSLIQLPFIYFPGWRITVDNYTVSPLYNNTYGLIQLYVSEGNHNINAQFKETPVRQIADAVSIFSFLMTCAVSFILRKYQKQ